MAIFDAAIFDGPPTSTIFDTGAGIPVTRDPVLSRAAVHDIQSRAAIHDTKGSGSIHDTKGSARVSN